MNYARFFGSRATARFAVFVLFLLISAVSAAAGVWVPDHSLRMIVPYAPGGTADMMARLVATSLGNALGQSVVVENHGGANGVIGTELVARADPDGYVIGMASLSGHAGNATLAKRLPYDSLKSFAPITFTGQSPLVLVVNPANGAKSVKDLIARAKSEKHAITFATAGIGIANHIAGELLKLKAAQEGVEMIDVPFRGGGPAMLAVMGGQVDMQFNPLSSVLPFITEGRLRPLAIADQQRSNLIPNVPTMVEAGYPDFYMIESFGLLAPAGTPAAVVQRLNAETVKALREPGLVKHLAAQGVELVPDTPDQLRAFMTEEINKYRDIIQRGGIKAE